MLKWSVHRRDSQTPVPPRRTAADSCTSQRRSVDGLRERRRQRRSGRRATLCLSEKNRYSAPEALRDSFLREARSYGNDLDKENRTPGDNKSILRDMYLGDDFDRTPGSTKKGENALRDLSNLGEARRSFEGLDKENRTSDVRKSFPSEGKTLRDLSNLSQLRRDDLGSTPRLHKVVKRKKPCLDKAHCGNNNGVIRKDVVALPLVPLITDSIEILADSPTTETEPSPAELANTKGLAKALAIEAMQVVENRSKVKLNEGVCSNIEALKPSNSTEGVFKSLVVESLGCPIVKPPAESAETTRNISSRQRRTVERKVRFEGLKCRDCIGTERQSFRELPVDVGEPTIVSNKSNIAPLKCGPCLAVDIKVDPPKSTDKSVKCRACLGMDRLQNTEISVDISHSIDCCMKPTPIKPEQSRLCSEDDKSITSKISLVKSPSLDDIFKNSYNNHITSRPVHQKPTLCTTCVSSLPLSRFAYATTLPISSFNSPGLNRPTSLTTLPRLPPSPRRSMSALSRLLPQEANSPTKRAKIDHVGDFLRQISVITSPEDGRLRGRVEACRATEVSVSPLLRKFVDLRFSRVNLNTPSELKIGGVLESTPEESNADAELEVDNSMQTSKDLQEVPIADNLVDVRSRKPLTVTFEDLDGCMVESTSMEDIASEPTSANEDTQLNKSPENRLDYNSNTRSYLRNKLSTPGRDDSSEFQDMSIDDIANALLDTTRPHPQRQNEENHISEENRTNSLQELEKTGTPEVCGSSTGHCCYREGCGSNRKVESKKRYMESSLEEFDRSFALKRQRCIRRRRNPLVKDADDCPSTPKCAELSNEKVKDPVNDVSFNSSGFSDRDGQYERFSISGRGLCSPFGTPGIFSEERKVLSPGDDSIAIAASSTPTKAVDGEDRGTIDVRILFKNGSLIVHVLRCRDLSRTCGHTINAYAKVSLVSEGTQGRNRRAAPQRTAVQADSRNPQFDSRFRFRLSRQDYAKKIQLEVWHRDRTHRRSESIGCVSFPIKNAVKKVITGAHPLRPAPPPVATPGPGLPARRPSYLAVTRGVMAERSQSTSASEVMSADGSEPEVPVPRSGTDITPLAEQQRDADAHLFLRYLELDPTEGPDAAPAAAQRKASGNRGGRTPFTCTKRLCRAARSGFGFSVLWTHPPRVERVEKGMPAEKAGMLPGDYIIFVDKHNVVTMPEIDVLNLIRSYGNTLTLEIFRKNARNGVLANAVSFDEPSIMPASVCAASAASSGPPTVVLPPANTATTTPCPIPCLPPPPSAAPRTVNGSQMTLHRPSTGCSTVTGNTASVDLSRRKLNLPQVTFSAERAPSSEEEARRRALHQLINKEQQYATALQFAATRFVSALAERPDLVTPHEHHVLFQNSEEILRITEDIVESLVHEDGDPQTHLLAAIYESKLCELTAAYRRYCSGLKRADLLLATKTKGGNTEFCRFLQTPAVPRRRPDITAFLHKPLEHFRDVLRLLGMVLGNTPAGHEDHRVLGRVVHELQAAYREITAEAGLMEPVGEGRPLLSVQDLENRLVFTKCKPFVLSKPGRQWIFGGDLSRVEGRTVHTYWALLFTDMLLFAKVSRDRVLFITEEPLPLAHVTEVYFNVRKKATEFRLTVDTGARKAQSPTAHCGPDLTRTPRKNAGRRCVVLRAPTLELKAVWQNLLQRQLYHVNTGLDGSSLSSPLESPEVPFASSLATLQSAESLSLRRQDTVHFLNPLTSRSHRSQLVALRKSPRKQMKMYHFGPSLQTRRNPVHPEVQRRLDQLIEHKCQQLSKTGTDKGGAIHLEQWMKGQLGRGGADGTPEPPEPDPEPEPEVWTAEELRRRSEQLQVSEGRGGVLVRVDGDGVGEEIVEVVLSDHERSPSRSTTTESQVTVRSSPLVPEQIAVCKQCHENCISNSTTTASTAVNIHHTNNNVVHGKCHAATRVQQNGGIAKSVDGADDEWGSLMLMGLAAINPTASFLKAQDPFSPKMVPKISVMPPTPDQTSITNCNAINFTYNENTHSPMRRKIMPNNLDLIKDYEDSPDDSPQNEQPYTTLGNCTQALRRYGTLSSLEKLTEDHPTETLQDSSSESGDERDDVSTNTDPGQAFGASLRSWTARAGSFVTERMAFFERFAEDVGEDRGTATTGGGGFFNRYLSGANGKKDEVGNVGYEEDCETSNATSGEEIWGTPTSGGELEDPLTFPNSDGGNVSPHSMSTNDDDTELMMDELLMAAPVVGATVRGLLPRRRLEPLLEEDSDTYTTSSTSSVSGSSEEGSSAAGGSSAGGSERVTPSPKKGNGTGAAADACWGAAVALAALRHVGPAPAPYQAAPPAAGAPLTSPENPETPETPVHIPEPVSKCAQDACASPSLARSPSYRRIVEQAEEEALAEAITPTRLRSHAADGLMLLDGMGVGVPVGGGKPRTTRLLDFFNARRSERRVHESFTGSRQILRVFSKDSPMPDPVAPAYSQKPLSPMLNKDRQMDRRFWRQLSKRRRGTGRTQVTA